MEVQNPGQSHLILGTHDDPEEVVRVPARREEVVLEADLFGALLFEESEGDVVKDGEVLRRVAGADAGRVLIHGHVEDPVEAVLDRPVTAHDAGERCSVGGQEPRSSPRTTRSMG